MFSFYFSRMDLTPRRLDFREFYSLRSIQRSFDREKVRIMGMGGEGPVYSNYVVGQKASLLYI